MQKITVTQAISFLVLAGALGLLSYTFTSYLTSNSDITNTATNTSVTSLVEQQIEEIAETGTDVAVAESANLSEVGSTQESDVAQDDVSPAVTAPEPVLTDSGQRETITLAGGCFWCTEAYLQETPGVVSAISGYAGGSADDANYKAVSRGKTEHREAVQVVFDPVRVSLDEILEAYWTHIDPTDSGGQFADRGFHYTTAIYYHSDAQRTVAESSRSSLSTSGLFTGEIATEILPFTTFFEAEEYHQDYYQKASAHYERYKKASGRAGFIEDNWAKDAALQFFEEQEDAAPETVVFSAPDKYVERTWSRNEILAGQAALPADVYRIVVQEGTEPKHTNEYNDFWEAGIYVDVVTGRPLYSSTHKYESGSGWPAFYRPISESAMIYEDDFKLFFTRTEVRSESGHLGHVFDDGPDEHGGKRHCINSLALDFVPLAEMESRGYGDYLYLF